MRALLSVYDKTGLVPFASRLHSLGYELVSTGGSARALTEAGLPVLQVEDVTGFPEILDGRVKTLHPNIHAGLLARRDIPAHQDTLDALEIAPIDLLVSNLYPFRETLADPQSSDEERIEQIDIGGPAMVRAAAKNFSGVLVVTSPTDYDDVLVRLDKDSVDLAYRRELAAKAFQHVSTYDALVADFLAEDEPDEFPRELSIGLLKAQDLRYGENPQQAAAAYRTTSAQGHVSGVLDATQLHGKELSFNNLLDVDAAWTAAQMSSEPTASVIKHMVPCGLASRGTIADAYTAAYEGDTVSAFGGIVGLNRAVDLATAELLGEIFLEIVIAPGFEPDALDRLKRKKNLRLLEMPATSEAASNARYDVRPISGGMLVQTPDSQADDPSTWQVATDRQPTEEEWSDLEFAWKVARLVKSNAIVFARDQVVVGVGAGQPNRLESVAIASRKAGANAQGAAMASDAFFPFADGILQGLDAGVSAVIQPGGSVRDDEVIKAVNEAGATMVFTGTRHFRH